MRASLMLATAIAVAFSVGTFAPSADAARVKECGTTTTTEPTGRGNFTVTETETQTAACHSASDTGEVITTETGPVTNKGGNAPAGQQDKQ